MWLLGGHAWLLPGGNASNCSGGVCNGAPRGACSWKFHSLPTSLRYSGGGHAWIMHGCSQGAPDGCSQGGLMCGCSP